MLRVCTGHVLITNSHCLIWPHLTHMPSTCWAYTPPIHLDICNSSINNFEFSILFELHVHCICAGWAWSKAERGPKLNFKFGPRWTFGPRRVFCGPRRAVSPKFGPCWTFGPRRAFFGPRRAVSPSVTLPGCKPAYTVGCHKCPCRVYF